MIPQTLKNSQLFVEGVGYAGRTSEVVLPKLMRKMEEYRGGGMVAPVEIDMGMEKLEATITLAEWNADVIKLFGISDVAGVGLRLMAALERDDGSNTVDSVEVVLRGRWRELEQEAVKTGENSPLKITAAISYYKYSHNRSVLVEIDAPNMTQMIGGKDQLKGQRSAIGL